MKFLVYTLLLSGVLVTHNEAYIIKKPTFDNHILCHYVSFLCSRDTKSYPINVSSQKYGGQIQALHNSYQPFANEILYSNIKNNREYQLQVSRHSYQYQSNKIPNNDGVQSQVPGTSFQVKLDPYIHQHDNPYNNNNNKEEVPVQVATYIYQPHLKGGPSEVAIVNLQAPSAPKFHQNNNFNKNENNRKSHQPQLNRFANSGEGRPPQVTGTNFQALSDPNMRQNYNRNTYMKIFRGQPEVKSYNYQSQSNGTSSNSGGQPQVPATNFQTQLQPIIHQKYKPYNSPYNSNYNKEGNQFQVPTNNYQPLSYGVVPNNGGRQPQAPVANFHEQSYLNTHHNYNLYNSNYNKGQFQIPSNGYKPQSNEISNNTGGQPKVTGTNFWSHLVPNIHQNNIFNSFNSNARGQLQAPSSSFQSQSNRMSNIGVSQSQVAGKYFQSQSNPSIYQNYNLYNNYYNNRDSQLQVPRNSNQAQLNGISNNGGSQPQVHQNYNNYDYNKNNVESQFQVRSNSYQTQSHGILNNGGGQLQVPTKDSIEHSLTDVQNTNINNIHKSDVSDEFQGSNGSSIHPSSDVFQSTENNDYDDLKPSPRSWVKFVSTVGKTVKKPNVKKPPSKPIKATTYPKTPNKKIKKEKKKVKKQKKVKKNNENHEKKEKNKDKQEKNRDKNYDSTGDIHIDIDIGDINIDATVGEDDNEDNNRGDDDISYYSSEEISYYDSDYYSDDESDDKSKDERDNDDNNYKFPNKMFIPNPAKRDSDEFNVPIVDEDDTDSFNISVDDDSPGVITF